METENINPVSRVQELLTAGPQPVPDLESFAEAVEDLIEERLNIEHLAGPLMAQVSQMVAPLVAQLVQQALHPLQQKICQLETQLVNLPKILAALPTPQITVAVPPAQPVITVETPTRKSKRTISYDEQNRPSTVEELRNFGE